MRRTWIVAILFTVISLILSACSTPTTSPTSTKTNMTFETIGIKGSTAFISLVSPSPDAVSPAELANKLRADWQNQLKLNTYSNYQNQVHVMVFDNKEAPQRWLQIWDKLATMSDQEWNKEQGQIFPHRIANYDRNTTSGLNEVQILSRDAKGNVVQTIKF